MTKCEVGQEVAISDLALMVLSLMGNPARALFGELGYRPNEIWRMFADNTKTRELLGWSPAVTLSDGLARTIEWYRSHRDRYESGPDLPRGSVT